MVTYPRGPLASLLGTLLYVPLPASAAEVSPTAIGSPFAGPPPSGSSDGAVSPVLEAADNAAVDGGLLGGPDGQLGGNLGGDPDELMQPGDVAAYLGEEGAFTWSDAGSETSWRLLDPSEVSGLASAAAGVGTSGATIDALASAAGMAYAPSASSGSGGLGESDAAANGTTWFASASGEPHLLVGGLIVLFVDGTSRSAAAAMFERHGISGMSVSALDSLDGMYFVATSSDVETLQLVTALSGEPSVRSVGPNTFTPQGHDSFQGHIPNSGGGVAGSFGSSWCTAADPPLSDPLSHCLWHLNADGAYEHAGVDPVVDINIGDVWETTKGEGVPVVVVDTAIQLGHEDLAANVDLGKTFQTASANTAETHGTKVAGVIAARDNDIGTRGVAPRATLLSYNFLDYQNTLSEINALSWQQDIAAAYNMSYGAVRGHGYTSENDRWKAALDSGLRHGYGGLGSLYVTSAGNQAWEAPPGEGWGSAFDAWTSMEEQSNHLGVVTVCAVGADGKHSTYSARGPSLWVCAPSSQRAYFRNPGWGDTPGIVTTSPDHRYLDDFGGTSAATPMVTGVVALVRSANPGLTWRDVKVLLANTASRVDSGHASWASGAQRYGPSREPYWFSDNYGFGLVDAEAAVEAALTWPALPPMRTWTGSYAGAPVILPGPGRSVSFPIEVRTEMDFAEHVSLEVDWGTVNARNFRVTLVSPSGATSVLAPETINGSCERCSYYGKFEFGSSRHLGEDPSGTWTLRIENKVPPSRCSGGNVPALLCPATPGTFKGWKAEINGHEHSPWVGVSASSYRPSEGDTLNVTASITGTALQSGVTVPVAVTAGTATAPGSAGSDYTALTPPSITIPAGQTSATATMQITADSAVEPAETFTIGVGTLPASLSGYRTLAGPQTVTIQGDVPVVSIGAGDPVTEGTAASFTLTANPAPPGDLTVHLRVSQQGEFAAAADIGATTATIPASGRVVFTVATDNDELAEVAGAITVSVEQDKRNVALYAPTSIAVDATATVTVADDDAVTITVAPVTDVVEGQTAQFAVTATPAPIADLPVTIEVSQQGSYASTALMGTKTVTVPARQPGELTASATYEVATQQDSANNPDGSVTLTVQAGSGYLLGTPATQTAAVLGDDNPQRPIVAITSNGFIREGQDAVFTVAATPAPAANLSVPVTVSDSAAFANAADLGAKTVTISAGASSAELRVRTVGDNVFEQPGTITAALDAPSGSDPYATDPSSASSEAAVSEATVPRLGISAGQGVAEGGTATFTVSANTVPASDLTVHLTVRDPLRYAPNSQAGARTVTIPAGEATAVLEVVTEDNSRDQPNGPIIATLDPSADPALYTLDPNAHRAEAVIADNDGLIDRLPTLSIHGARSFTEGERAVFTIATSAPSATDFEVRLFYEVRGNYMTPEASRNTDTVLTFPAGATSIQFSLPTINDNRYEEDGELYVTLLAPRVDVYRLDELMMVAYAKLNDNDDATANSPTPTVTINSGDPVTEGGAAIFTITAQPAPAQPIGVNVIIRQPNGSLLASGEGGLRTVTIPANSTQAVLRVLTDDDDNDEYDHTVVAAVGTGVGYQVGQRHSEWVRVFDNDQHWSTLSAAVNSVLYNTFSESQLYAQFFTVRSPHVRVPGGKAAFHIWREGNHVSESGQQVRDMDGYNQSYSFRIATNQQDNADTHLTITLLPNATYNLNGHKVSRIRIVDNDRPALSVSAPESVDEGGSIEFTVTSDRTPHAPMTVYANVSAYGDYGIDAGPVEITLETSGTGTFTVTTDDDNAMEPDGFVLLELRPANDYHVSDTEPTQVDIVDGDTTLISTLASNHPRVVYIDLIRSIQREHIADHSDDAVDADWKQVLRALGDPLYASFHLGAMTAAGARQIHTDNGLPEWEPIGDAIAYAENYFAQPPGSPIVTIRSDGDTVEGSAATFTITANPAPISPITVKIGVTETGSVGASGPATITVSGASTTYTVTTTDDDTIEPNGTVTATVQAGSGYTIGVQSSATATVADDDTPVVSISAGGDITEGGSVEFTVSSSPLPKSALAVRVAITRSGGFGVSPEVHTVTLPVAGTATISLATDDDDVYEPDGSVTATVRDGQGYVPSTTAGTATVQVADNEPLPVVSIHPGIDITEGDNLDFWLRASPKPAQGVRVRVSLAIDTNFGINLQDRYLNIDGSGEKFYVIGTWGDFVDEPDDYLVLTVEPGAGYTVDADKGVGDIHISDNDGQPSPKPDVSISAGSGITEGGKAQFTLSASTVPERPMKVKLRLTELGDFGATGTTTVTMSAATATYEVDTTDDTTDEADGSVAVEVLSPSRYSWRDEGRYRVDGDANSATVAVADDDGLPSDHPRIVYASLISDVYSYITDHSDDDVGVWWKRVLKAFGHPDYVDYVYAAATAADARQRYEDTQLASWQPIGYALDYVEAYNRPQVTPAVTIAAGSDVTEGTAASFVLTASPLQRRAFEVNVNVAATGSFGVTTGVQKVTIPTSGTATLTVDTTNDEADETDGTVTATVQTGTGYTVGTPSTGTVNVSDDDPTPKEPSDDAPLVKFAALIERIKTDMASPNYRGEAHDLKRVLKTLGVPGYETYNGGTVGVQEATNRRTRPADNPHWEGIAAAITYKLNYNPVNPPPPDPEVSITAGAGVSEGTAASFTLNASPAPASAVTVKVNIGATGSYGVATGVRDITVPTSGTVSFTVPTTGDSVDELNGSVTATVQAGTGYTVDSSADDATVQVADDDAAPAAVPPLEKFAALVKSFYDRITATSGHGNGAAGGWNKRFLKAMGHPEYVNYPQDAVTVARAQELYDHGGPGANTAWEGTVEALEYKIAYDAGQVTVDPVIPPPPDPDPEITISAGAGVTEGADASFTLNASPAPTTALTVKVDITAAGSYGVTTGARNITVPTSGTVTFTVPTTGDDVDEPDGSTTATVQTGSGYTVGTPSAGTVTIADNDDPPVVVPEITISAGAGVIEGADASFTLNASPAPATGVTVKVNITASGSFGVTTGVRNITVPTSGTVTFTVPTTGDDVDEADGSATATVQAGTGYTVGTPSAGTVAIADNDDPPVVVPEITISAGAGVTEGTAASFTLNASPVPATAVTVRVDITASGSFGVTTGVRNITVPTSGTVTFTVPTTGDDNDETDGSATATVQTGTGYTVGTPSAGSVAIADNDDPPKKEDPKADFVASIEQLRDDYSAYEDWATGTYHQYMVHYSSGEILALLNADTHPTNSVSNQALFFRAIRAAKGTRDNDAAALFAKIRDHYKIKRIG